MELLPPGELKTPVAENLPLHTVVLTAPVRHGTVIPTAELHEPRSKGASSRIQAELHSKRLNPLALDHHDEPESEGSVVLKLLP